MRSAWHEDSALYRPGARWGSLLALALVAGCGGDREAAPPAGEGTVAAVDTAAAPATPAPGDTAAPAGAASASADTTGSRGDTTTKSQPSPAAAAQPSKPIATPAPRPTPKPAAEKPAVEKPAAEKPAPTPTSAPPSPPPDTSATARAGADQPLRDAYHQAPRDTVDQATYDGWKQFNLNCARCHGEDVLGTTIAPHLIMSLKPDGPINTKELFVQTVCAGRPAKGMPAWCALGMDPATINEIYAYVHGRSEGKIGPGRPALKAGG
ncbi:MAG TPA: c-type cytochrome [Gemmatimonadales bacterium]|jgi:hypothetical protein